jgi:exopolyphosphatase/guanosine-5'-triphosphate,3'-diphosphate pyrophosphatase
MGKFATIDVGSNQVLLCIANIEHNMIAEVIADRGEITRLGEGVAITGILKPEASERTRSVLRSYTTLMTRYEVVDCAAVGTAALREAENSHDFVTKVKEETGIHIEVITGEEEARLSFLAVTGGLDLHKRETTLIDIGGGSTEFIFGRGSEITDRFSLGMGALKYTERFLKTDPVKNEELKAMEGVLGQEFKGLVPPFENFFMVGMGGTITNLGAMKHKLETYDPDVVHGSEITFDELESFTWDLKTKTINERKKIRGLQPKRAEVILAGVVILTSIMKRLKVDSITISDRGLRHGLMLDRFCS